jgi:hypothetical protein
LPEAPEKRDYNLGIAESNSAAHLAKAVSG